MQLQLVNLIWNTCHVSSSLKSHLHFVRNHNELHKDLSKSTNAFSQQMFDGYRIVDADLVETNMAFDSKIFSFAYAALEKRNGKPLPWGMSM